MDNIELMKPLEAAEYLKISRRKLDLLKSNREVAYIKIGGYVRFRKSDLDKFLSNNVIEPV